MDEEENYNVDIDDTNSEPGLEDRSSNTKIQTTVNPFSTFESSERLSDKRIRYKHSKNTRRRFLDFFKLQVEGKTTLILIILW